MDEDNMEFLTTKKNSFTQKIENMTEFCLSKNSEIFNDN
jgi:hypothetical protein